MRWNLGTLALAALAAGCGSSSSSEPAGASAGELIANLCARSAEQGCTSSAQDCDEAMRRAWNEAVRVGCRAEYDAVLRCMNGSDIECDANPRDLCPDLAREFEECESSSGSSSEECSAGFTPSLPDAGPGVSCSIACAAYGAECTGASQEGPLDCTCSSGPNSGLAFTAPDCGSALSSSVAAACQ